MAAGGKSVTRWTMVNRRRLRYTQHKHAHVCIDSGLSRYMTKKVESGINSSGGRGTTAVRWLAQTLDYP